jgi:hypothetical protein
VKRHCTHQNDQSPKQWQHQVVMTIWNNLYLIHCWKWCNVVDVL